MDHLGTFVPVSLDLYALGTGIYLISENRRPQALWQMLGSFFLPGIGLLAYLVFGRDRKAFATEGAGGDDRAGQELFGRPLDLELDLFLAFFAFMFDVLGGPNGD